MPPSRQRSRQAKGQAEPKRRSPRKTNSGQGNGKGKERAVPPEETMPAESGVSPTSTEKRRKRNSTGQTMRDPQGSSRPAKKVRIASMSDPGPSGSGLSENRSSVADPSSTNQPNPGLSSSEPLGDNRPPPAPEPSPREASDAESRPAKRARTDESSEGKTSGDRKGKQKAVPTAEPPINAPSSPYPRNSTAPGPSSHDQSLGASGSHSTGAKLSFWEWSARRSVSVSLHKSTQAGSSPGPHGDTLEGVQPQAPTDPSSEVSNLGPSPLPISPPIIQPTVARSSPPEQAAASDDGGVSDKQGEVDMSLSNTGGEGTEQGLVVLDENSQAHSDEPLAPTLASASADASQVDDMVSNARSVLTQVRSRAETSATVPTASESGPLVSETERERRKQDSRAAVQHAVQVLQGVTGRQMQSPVLPANRLDAGAQQNAATPLATVADSVASAAVGPSVQQSQSQVPVEEIGNRMLDLDLANRAPVRARKPHGPH
ncbi:hypothetical protein RSOL_032530, partial [Rhizoctonia solani AG-3 Rhs1AP]